MFDSSVTRGKPATFPLNRVIAGLDRGRAADGRRARSAASGFPKRSPTRDSASRKGMLVFDVELTRASPTRAPADVKAPPADAKSTASGLAYKVLTAGHRHRAAQSDQTR